MGICNSDGIFRLQNGISRHPRSFFFLDLFLVLHPAECLSVTEVCWPLYSHWKPPSSYVIHPYPVSFLRHFLILPVNRKSPLIRVQTMAEKKSLPFPLCCTPWQFPERRSRWSPHNRLPGQSRALREQKNKMKDESKWRYACDKTVLTPYFTVNSQNICHIMQKSTDCEPWVLQSIIHHISETICMQEKEDLSIEFWQAGLVLVSPRGRAISWLHQLCQDRLAKCPASNRACGISISAPILRTWVYTQRKKKNAEKYAELGF